MEGTMSAHVSHGTSGSVVYREPSEYRDYPMLSVTPRSASMAQVLIVPELDMPTKRVTADHVRFARELVEAAQCYLTELVRAHIHDAKSDRYSDVDDEEGFQRFEVPSKLQEAA